MLLDKMTGSVNEISFWTGVKQTSITSDDVMIGISLVSLGFYTLLLYKLASFYYKAYKKCVRRAERAEKLLLHAEKELTNSFRTINELIEERDNLINMNT